MKRLGALGLGLCLLGAWRPAPSLAAALPATISGTVTNGTPGAAAPPGLVLTAVQLSESGSELARREAGTDGSTFRIDGLEAVPGARYLVATDYLGVTYSTVVEPPAGEVAVTADVTIFETTGEDSSISVVSDTLTMVEGEQGVVEILQLLRLRNAAPRTFVGREASGQRAVLRLPVPFGAFDLSGRGGVPIQDGFSTADPVLPGESSVSYAYRVRVPRGGWPLDRAMFYPTSRIDLIVGPGLTVSAHDLAFQEEMDLGGLRYRRYRGGPFAAGAVLAAHVQPPSPPGEGYWWGLAAGIVTLLGAAVCLPLIRRRRLARAPGDRQRLIGQIASLDEAFSAGGVAEARYARARRRLKSRLVGRPP